MAYSPPPDAAILRHAAVLLNVHGTKAAAARAMGIPRTTFSEYIARAERAEREANGLSNEPLTTAEYRLNEQVKTLKKDLSAAQDARLSEAVVREEIMGLTEHTVNPPAWKANATEIAEGPGVPAVLCSDWHFSEFVDPEAVNNYNSYDMVIAERRIRLLTQKVVELGKHYIRGSEHVPGLVAMFGGDILSGDIHEELKETNDEPLMKALLSVLDLIVGAIGVWREEFGAVVIPWVIGNHARNTNKPRQKEAVYSNFDWLLGCLVERHFADDDRVSVSVSGSLDARLTISGWDYLLTHGNEIGAFGGDGLIGSIGPIMRGDFKLGRQAARQDTPYDVLVLGHFHSCRMMGGVICNGSLMGYNEFAHNKRFPPEPPQQAMWFTHPEMGIVYSMPILLEPTERKVADAWAEVTG